VEIQSALNPHQGRPNECPTSTVASNIAQK
jgi:hypothetical protein